MDESIKLNIGCGQTKILGYIGVDTQKSDAADVICDITRERLPWENETVDHAVLSHVIEHIPEVLHPRVLGELWRVLKFDAEIFLAYPEFKTCAKYYIENARGMREYWKKTIFGRQLHPGDFHVALMDTEYFIDVLHLAGFEIIKIKPQEHNMLVRCKKIQKFDKREDVLNKEIFNGALAQPSVCVGETG